ncbi:MAG: hypothetical protein JXA14_19070, partial [Anaerolineae bacterium]|nr:hypothetical protein [Anaerolineae bacterium]
MSPEYRHKKELGLWSKVLRGMLLLWLPASLALLLPAAGVVAAPPPPSAASIVTTVDGTGTVGPYTSLALNSSGFPVISCYDEINRELKVAVCDDANCSNPALTRIDSADP